ncbi:MAG: primosomal protein N' [Candidatus Metalachnospira sp.]|nr:primosomal protein N' [Candidatus Metalachnospira sp.]
MYAQVILSISHTDIDRVFDYAIPEELLSRVKIGMRVRVPFGKGKSITEGYVVGVKDSTDVPLEKIKNIAYVPDGFPVFSETMLKLAMWMQERYFATLSKCLQTIIPSGIKDKTDYYKTVKYVRTGDNALECILKYENDKRRSKRSDVINLVLARGELPLAELKKINSEYTISVLRDEKALDVFDKKVLADTYTCSIIEETKPFEPNAEQKNILEEWKNEINDRSRPLLIHGITGSGKTEVYIRMIEQIIAEGKQAIVLVPEISLTPMMTGRFIKRFGNKAAVTHSRMNYRERFNCWKRAQDGDISVVIGPRSALFMPFDNLGVVIIDEEHEKSYVSETSPAYDAVETAEKLCILTGASLVMGTATPSVRTYYRCTLGDVRYTRLEKRAVEGSSKPEIEMVDMRDELRNGNRSIFSRKLYTALASNLQNKKQTMLFINRRGYSTFVSCRSCGYVMKCSHCDVSYKYHASNGKLICHYCGETVDKPDVCPACGSKYIRYFGTGTQKVEEEVRKCFPNARVLRMDMDTVSGKNGYADILNRFATGDADILVGTQMIAKGHDFKNVTLVGIMAADISLNTGEYNAAERTFQLITQVAGRAGRAEAEGKVIVQTYEPDNPAIIAAVKGDVDGFYRREIAFRKSMDYPPCEACAYIEITGIDEKNAIECAESAGYEFKKYEGMNVLGPVAEYISKIKDEYRYKIILRSKNDCILMEAVKEVYEKYRHDFENCGVYINPKAESVNMMQLVESDE